MIKVKVMAQMIFVILKQSKKFNKNNLARGIPMYGIDCSLV